MRRFAALVFAYVCLAQLPAPASASRDDRLIEQRAAFRLALPKARAGDASAVERNRDLLRDYPLYPDLEAAWLRTRVGRSADAQIAAFLEDHPDLSISRQLRYAWLRSLFGRGQWQAFLDLYEAHYAQRDDDVLRCMALDARIRLGHDDIAAEALELWLVGHSQDDRCDPVFAWLDHQGLITDDRRRQRLELALEEREFDLATYLAKSLASQDRDLVDRWRRMRAHPDDELRRFPAATDPQEASLLAYGYQRLSRRDPQRARSLWNMQRYQLAPPDAVQHVIDRDLALYSARRHMTGAHEMVLRLDRGSADDEVLAWGARAALRDGDWQALLQVLAALSPAEAEREVWRYWRARALEATGRVEQALPLYRELATERDYYGFLAADRLEQPYAFNHVPAVPDEPLLDRLARHPGLIRARELFYVNLNGRGRSEWEQLIASLSPEEQAQSAILAHRWGWHSRAIRTAGRSGLGDDLSILYPTPFESLFDRYTASLNLDPTWAYSVTRSESLFMPDVISHAGALGLMQVMPATGRQTAREAQVRYHSRYSLLDPDTNIALGTYYLNSMSNRFDGNLVLATAAYNAGPHRVARWLPERAMAADVWAETVPFTETRRYVRRVMRGEAIFYWRMTGQQRRLAAIMKPVQP